MPVNMDSGLLAEPVIEPATNLGFTRDWKSNVHKSATADLCGRTRWLGPGMTDHYASPDVSNMAESIASRADLPAQTTNWNAG